MKLRIWPVVALALALGCDAEDDDDDGGEDDEGGAGLVADVSTDECVSGRKWVGGNEESTLMRPGGDCIGCHAEEGEGPRYLVAGTVYQDVGEPDDCFGLAGATVEITDAEGSMWSLITNDAGNFWIDQDDGPVAFPFRAKVIHGDLELPMATEQSEGSCASCHTRTGENEAAGRIYIP